MRRHTDTSALKTNDTQSTSALLSHQEKQNKFQPRDNYFYLHTHNALESYAP